MTCINPLLLSQHVYQAPRSPTLTKQALSVAQLSRMCWAMVEPVFSTNSPRKSCTNFTSSGSSRLSRATDSWLHLTPKSSHLEQGIEGSSVIVIIQYFGNSDLYNATDSWLHLTPKSSHLAQGLVRSVIVNMFVYISDETSVQLKRLKQLGAFQDHGLLAKFDTKNLPPSTEIRYDHIDFRYL